MKKTYYIIVAVLVAIILLAVFIGIYLSGNPNANSNSTSNVIKVVAAENFWGSLVSQLGGTHVNVTSIVTDPNADPHEYESNAADAIAIANAQF
ncbi:MAG: zinc ABC transporter substrate-binding protein, partial [Candidatus Bathyarchaeia archaeon]